MTFGSKLVNALRIGCVVALCAGQPARAAGVEVVVLPGLTAEVRDLAVSPDGSLLAVGTVADTHGSVWLWNIADATRPALVGRLAASTEAVDDLAFGPDGRLLAAAGTVLLGGGGIVRVWDLATVARPDLIATLSDRASGPVGFGADSGTLVTGGGTGNPGLRIWAVRERAAHTVRDLGLGIGGVASSLGFRPDGRLAVAGGVESSSEVVCVWVSSTALDRLERDCEPTFSASESGRTFSRLLSPDGQTVLAGSGGWEHAVFVRWHIAADARLTPGTVPDTFDLVGAVRAMAFSPDSTLLAAGSGNLWGQVWRWRIGGTFSPTVMGAPLQGSTEQPIERLALTSDGHAVVAAGPDHAVRVWAPTDEIPPPVMP